MLDTQYGTPITRCGDVQIFRANASAVGNNWAPWYKPRGITMVHIFGVGAGGGGGNSVVGAASTAAGGGGGGSGSQHTGLIPAALLPDVLFVSVARGNPANNSTSVAAGFASYISVIANQGAPVANNVLFQVNAGASGGAATGATAGPAGTAGTISTVGQMPLGWGFNNIAVAGQIGIIGGTTIAGGALTLPVTGIQITGGTGGGGLPAANSAGSAGGLITVAAGSFVNGGANIPGGAGGASGANPGFNGLSGTIVFKTLFYSVGGTGGGSSGLTATPTGSNGGNGGPGGTGSGGGGGGGGFTGATAATGGRGGDSVIIITSW